MLRISMISLHYASETSMFHICFELCVFILDNILLNVLHIELCDIFCEISQV